MFIHVQWSLLVCGITQVTRMTDIAAVGHLGVRYPSGCHHAQDYNKPKHTHLQRHTCLCVRVVKRFAGLPPPVRLTAWRSIGCCRAWCLSAGLYMLHWCAADPCKSRPALTPQRPSIRPCHGEFQRSHSATLSAQAHTATMWHKHAVYRNDVPVFAHAAG